jgi:hypothetical protein
MSVLRVTKKWLAGALLVCAMTAVLSAQEQQAALRDRESPADSIKYFNARVFKVEDFRDSYVITYAKQTTGAAKLVITKEWYRQNPQKLKFRRLTGVLYPYMSVFYTDGEFNHIKLSLPLSRTNAVWGWIPSNNPNVPPAVPDDFPQFEY